MQASSQNDATQLQENEKYLFIIVKVVYKPNTSFSLFLSRLVLIVTPLNFKCVFLQELLRSHFMKVTPHPTSTIFHLLQLSYSEKRSSCTRLAVCSMIKSFHTSFCHHETFVQTLQTICPHLSENLIHQMHLIFEAGKEQ